MNNMKRKMLASFIPETVTVWLPQEAHQETTWSQITRLQAQHILIPSSSALEPLLECSSPDDPRMGHRYFEAQACCGPILHPYPDPRNEKEKRGMSFSLFSFLRTKKINRTVSRPEHSCFFVCLFVFPLTAPNSACLELSLLFCPLTLQERQFTFSPLALC